jgi:hypothetical protein
MDRTRTAGGVLGHRAAHGIGWVPVSLSVKPGAPAPADPEHLTFHFRSVWLGAHVWMDPQLPNMPVRRCSALTKTVHTVST